MARKMEKGTLTLNFQRRPSTLLLLGLNTVVLSAHLSELASFLVPQRDELVLQVVQVAESE